MKTLDDVRIEIDRVDELIIDLLVKRLDLAKQVASIKNSQTQTPVTDQSRENRIFEKIENQVEGVVYQNIIKSIYPHLFQASKTIRSLESSKTIPFKNVGIIGDGLIGRSIYKIIKAKSSAQVAIKNRDWEVEDFKNCDLIILASPISSIIEIAKTITKSHNQLKRDLVVIDVASVKEHIALEFDKLNQTCESIYFVPTHPMGGKQEAGSKSATSVLFANRPWVICHDGESQGSSIIKKVAIFVSFLGSNPIELDAKNHDILVTYTSHFPGILSKLLKDFVTSESPESLSISGSGFELMTRIGSTENIRMRKEIGEYNCRNLKSTTDKFIEFLKSSETSGW